MSSGIITSLDDRIAALGFSVGMRVNYHISGRLYCVCSPQVGKFGVSKDILTIESCAND